MMHFQDTVTFTALFFIVLFKFNNVDSTRVASPIIISSESDIVSSAIETNIKVDNISEDNIGNTYSKSSSISIERPLEDYINGKDLNIARRPTYGNWWDSCYVKAEKYCNKQCRKALKGVCKDYRCRSSVFSAIKRRCSQRCVSTYKTFVLEDKYATISDNIIPATNVYEDKVVIVPGTHFYG